MAKHVAASASNADALALAAKVAADTDDVIDAIIPDGNPHWTEMVAFVQPPTSKKMFIHADSAGDTGPDGGVGKTHIVDDRSENSDPILVVTPNSTGGYARRFGFTITQTNRTRDQGSGNISGHYNDPATPQRFRDDHNTYNCKSRGLGFGGRVIGVADHNKYNCEAATAVFFNSWSDGQGDKSWAEDTGLGTDNFPVIEDSIITTIGSAAICDSYRGSRYVIRFCNSDGASVQTHPTGGSNRARGTRAWEVYGVLVRNPGAQQHNFFFLSSATGMVCFNDVEKFNNFITMHCMRRDSSTYPQSPTPGGWGYAGKSFTGVGSNWDGNVDPLTGYPNIDMIGRGKGDELEGDFGAGMINKVTGKNYLDPGAWPRQALEPVYIFGNTHPGNMVTDQSAGTVRLKRDYYTDEVGGGIGKGLALPTGAGLPGEGFVLLNGGDWLKKTPEHGVTNIPNFRLFVRDAAGAWQPKYQPLEYPHPYIALTKYDGGPIVIPTDPPVPDEPAPLPNTPPTVKFVKPSGIGPAYELITDGKTITVKQQYIKLEADDDLGPVTLQIFIDNTLLAQNTNGEKTLQVKWNTNPHKGRDPLITGKVKDAADQTAEVKARVKVRH